MTKRPIYATDWRGRRAAARDIWSCRDRSLVLIVAANPQADPYVREYLQQALAREAAQVNAKGGRA